MLPSPARERRKSKNVGPLVEVQSISCEAHRDLVFARAREPLKRALLAQPLSRRTEPAF